MVDVGAEVLAITANIKQNLKTLPLWLQGGFYA
jgi:hypothetical protein